MSMQHPTGQITKHIIIEQTLIFVSTLVEASCLHCGQLVSTDVLYGFGLATFLSESLFDIIVFCLRYTVTVKKNECTYNNRNLNLQPYFLYPTQHLKFTVKYVAFPIDNISIDNSTFLYGIVFHWTS